MVREQKWPDTLWIVRHGQSAGNVARAEAEAAGRPVIDLAMRDLDVPLSELGKQQAQALGQWFRAMPAEQQPTIILSSPYLRARTTTALILETSGIDPEEITLITDERLREKEFGILDRLTKLGIQQKYPEQAEMRQVIGKFYHRPPGGESWCDVILRLRSVVGTITREYSGERVLIVGHQVVVLCLRYLLERLTEEQILAIDREQEVANCSVTAYQFDPTLGRQGKLILQMYNFVAPLLNTGTEVTTKPDVPIARK